MSDERQFRMTKGQMEFIATQRKRAQRRADIIAGLIYLIIFLAGFTLGGLIFG